MLLPAPVNCIYLRCRAYQRNVFAAYVLSYVTSARKVARWSVEYVLWAIYTSRHNLLSLAAHHTENKVQVARRKWVLRARVALSRHENTLVIRLLVKFFYRSFRLIHHTSKVFEKTSEFQSHCSFARESKSERKREREKKGRSGERNRKKKGERESERERQRDRKRQSANKAGSSRIKQLPLGARR